MKIATAYYDSNNTLVLPDFVVPPVFQEDRITTDVGFWHRYYTCLLYTSPSPRDS